MDTLWVACVLFLGIYFAVKLTQLANYFTFGQNREKKLKAQNKEQ